MSKYSEMTLPELYSTAYARGVVNFFGKTEGEMNSLLLELDETVAEDEAPPLSTKKGQKAKKPLLKKKGFRLAAERLVDEGDSLDELMDVSDLDEDDETEQTTSEKVSKMLGVPVKSKSGRDDEDYDNELQDDTEDFLEDMFESDDETESTNSDEEKEMAKPATKKTAAKKTAPAKKTAAKKEAPARGAVGVDSPYVEGTAGHCVFVALKKGGNIDTIVANADKLIEKAGAKPPSNTAAKVKIIMTEVNKGKKGDIWGVFSLNEKTGRISHVPA